MDRLRDDSGIALVRIHKLFGSREGIVLKVLNQRRAEWTAELARGSAQQSPRARIIGVFDVVIARAEARNLRGSGHLNTYAELAHSSWAITAVIRNLDLSTRSAILASVAQAGLEPALADQLSVLEHDAQSAAAVAGSALPAKHAKDAAETLSGLATRE